MGCCNDCLTCDIAFNAVMSLSCASTRGSYSRIEGVTSRLVIRAFPDLRSPIAWSFLAAEFYLEKCFECFRNYISESLGIIFTSQSPHRSGKASRRSVLTLLFPNFTKIVFRSRGYLGIVPMVLWWEHWLGASCQGFSGSVPGSWALRCCHHNFIVAVLEYLSLVRRHQKSLLCSSLVR